MASKIIDNEGFVRWMEIEWDEVEDRDCYPFNLPAVRSLTKLSFHPAVTFFVGENGSGKSTLLEGLAVALGFPGEGGSLMHAVQTKATHSELHDAIKVVRSIERPKDSFFMRAESMYNVATYLEEAEKWGGPSKFGKLHYRSHGEAFLQTAAAWNPKGLYLMDEPESALSPQRQLSLLNLMFSLTERGSQFIVATHSPMILAYPDAWIYEFTESGIEKVEYEDTEHYQLTRAFLLNRESFLGRLKPT